jgi:glycosyltransferase involved in cell wall biosynthesis
VDPFISVIIPNRNGAETIGKCLEGVYSSGYKNFEAIVVDDCSEDGSVETIERFPCKLVRLESHGGASKARNTGAENAGGEALFFIDADCVLNSDTLAIAAKSFRQHKDKLVGGTYTPLPYDRGLYSTFQSVFINYSETKYREPDYVATHAMLIDREIFLKSGGFNEEFLPILEDVEFSHRLRKSGTRLIMLPDLTVRHIFNFTLVRSLRNAFRKSMYWTMYSIRNKDLLADSGTASLELKSNTISWLLCALLLALFVVSGGALFIYAALAVLFLNLVINRRFIKALVSSGGLLFAAGAVLYYTSLYPLAVGVGGLMGVLKAVTGDR